MDECKPEMESRVHLWFTSITLETAPNMKAKDTLQALYREADAKFCQQFGFKIRDATFTKVVDYMYAPKDPSSLAVTRILFGLAMLLDIPEGRGGREMMQFWGDPKICHFPLIPILTSVGMPYMALVYAVLWVGALCIMLGYKFRIAAPVFTICYWYLFLIDKSLWNNHSYLYGLVALLLSCTQADCYWSLDTYLDPSKKKSTVPYWNYFILKYQFFIMYFIAGCKKNSPEWLTGYSQQNLSKHWLFGPFKLFLTVPQTDYLVTWFACVFDMTVALWMMCSSTRLVTTLFCVMFHLMNNRLFHIGMFPWVCLATMPLFYPFDWPKILASYTTKNFAKLKHCLCKKIKKHIEEPCSGRKTKDSTDQVNQTDGNVQVIEKEDQESKEYAKIDDKTEIAEHYVEVIQDKHNIVEENKQCAMNETKLPETINNNLIKDENRRNVTVYLIILYVLIQAFLPYSHFITKGYNNWTNGLYGYSWDMMIHNWSTKVCFNVVDNDRNEVMFINQMHTLSDGWLDHGDMVLQLAQCVKNLDISTEDKWSDPSKVLTTNLSVYVDLFSSLNGRFFQRIFDPKVDLLKATWSPFSEVSFLMPLLDETGYWRKYLDEIRSDVHSWSEHSNVEFFAEFPGYEHKSYISVRWQNVTLTVLEGVVVITPELTNQRYGHSVKLTKGNRVTAFPGMYNKILNIGEEPAVYMYTFYKTYSRKSDLSITNFNLPVLKELLTRFNDWIMFGDVVISNIFQILRFSQCSS